MVVSSDTAVTGAGSTNADAHIIKDVSIEEETSLEIMSGQKYVLATTDILQVYADNANLDVVFSFMEIT